MTDYVYVGAGGWRAADRGAPTQGLFRLDPASGQWECLNAGLPDSVEVHALALQPGTPAVLWAGTQFGPCRSRDGGETWELRPLPGSERVVWSLLAHPHDPRILYAGTTGTSIYKSGDSGETWRALSVPAPRGLVKTSFPTRVIRLAIDPREPDALYAALEVGGVMRSRDGGESWADCNGGLLDFAQEPRFKSRIVSDTDTEGMMDSHALALSPARPGMLFLANRMGLFRSGDRGIHWDDMAIGRFSPLTYARDVRVSPHDPKTLYAALSVAAVSDAGSLYRSRDLGETWQRFDHGVAIESTLMVVAPSAADPGRVYCAARRGQVFGTEDGGATWREYRLPGSVQGVYALAAA